MGLVTKTVYLLSHYFGDNILVLNKQLKTIYKFIPSITMGGMYKFTWGRSKFIYSCKRNCDSMQLQCYDVRNQLSCKIIKGRLNFYGGLKQS